MSEQGGQDIVVVAGKTFVIERLNAFGDMLYGCGVLPLRRRREDLLKDIERAQGPEWRVGTAP